METGRRRLMEAVSTGPTKSVSWNTDQRCDRGPLGIQLLELGASGLDNGGRGIVDEVLVSELGLQRG